MASEEAARLLGVSPDTIRRNVTKGYLRGTRLGRRFLVNRAHVEEILAAGQAPVASVVIPNNRKTKSDRGSR